jgi:hypothetical protein
LKPRARRLGRRGYKANMTARGVQAEVRVPFLDLRHENDTVKDVVRRRAEPGIRAGRRYPEPVHLAPAHRHLGLDSVCRAVRAYLAAP